MPRAMLVFSALALIAASGRACDEDGGGQGEEQPPTGNSVNFDTGSPVSPAAGQLKASGSILAGAGWTRDKLEVKVLDANGNEAGSATKTAPNAMWSYTFTGLNTGTYTVVVKGTFSSGTKTEPKQITSGKVIVQ